MNDERKIATQIRDIDERVKDIDGAITQYKAEKTQLLIRKESLKGTLSRIQKESEAATSTG